jgi:hypothetical protein
MNFFSILTLLLFLALFATAQEQGHTIKVKNVQEYTSRKTEIYNTIKKSIEAGEIDKIKEIRNYKFVIENQTSKDTIGLLDNYEREYISFLLQDYDQLLNGIISNKHCFAYNYSLTEQYALANYYESGGFPLQITMSEFWIKSKNDILNQIKSSNQTNYEKRLLEIYWQFLINLHGSPENSFSQYDINDIASELINQNENPKYNDFIKTYLRYQYAETNWGLGIDWLLYGNSFYTNELSDYCTNGYTMSLGLDLSYKKLLFNARLSILDSDLKKNMANGVSLNTKRSIRAAFFEFNGGYSVIDNKRIRITPGVGIALGKIQQHENDTIKISSDFAALPNLYVLADFKVRFHSKRNNTNNVAESKNKYWLVRLQGGCHPFGFNNYEGIRGSILYLKIGFGGFFTTTKRKID